MKLSDVKGDRAIDVIAEIIEPIANIASDESVQAMFRPGALPDGITAMEFMLQRLKTGLPKLLKDHKNDVISILATIEGVSKSDYVSSLNLPKLMRDCIELLNDEAFLTLFT